ncbi:DMT family transporter [Clostridium brassicae]|uniref:DMT family transporter n=1 Tax=Clostridium brassicae TaxID=2999072 RepID=A0ABT4D4E2_9CLOT|nr:DMT family transporter [Clostridium brassicae]MCY6957160.1 DMT family transporter [Clostridium brassicae]
MLYVVLALISGCLVILSMVINSHLAKKIGIFQGTFVNYLVGLLFISIILILKNEFRNLSFNILSYIPFWAYLGGLIGVSVVAISNIIIPKIPTIYSTLLIFLGQLFTGIAIDYCRGNLISKGKIIGGLFIIAGLIYNFNIDKQES